MRTSTPNQNMAHTNNQITLPVDLNRQLFVYPNPSNGKINIDLGKEYSMVNIKVTNSSGQVTQSSTSYNKKHLNLELKGNPGYYFIELDKKGENISIIKVLKH